MAQQGQLRIVIHLPELALAIGLHKFHGLLDLHGKGVVPELVQLGELVGHGADAIVREVGGQEADPEFIEALGDVRHPAPIFEAFEAVQIDHAGRIGRQVGPVQGDGGAVPARSGVFKILFHGQVSILVR